jgi:hypothetical protein
VSDSLRVCINGMVLYIYSRYRMLHAATPGWSDIQMKNLPYACAKSNFSAVSVLQIWLFPKSGLCQFDSYIIISISFFLSILCLHRNLVVPVRHFYMLYWSRMVPSLSCLSFWSVCLDALAWGFSTYLVYIESVWVLLHLCTGLVWCHLYCLSFWSVCLDALAWGFSTYLFYIESVWVLLHLRISRH